MFGTTQWRNVLTVPRWKRSFLFLPHSVMNLEKEKRYDTIVSYSFFNMSGIENHSSDDYKNETSESHERRDGTQKSDHPESNP